MKKSLIFLCFILISQIAWTQKNEVEIKGTITDGSQPLSDVNIKIADNSNGTKTDSQGNYQLNANEGDRLVFTHVGYTSIEIIIEDVDRVLNLIMYPEIQDLDNVTVTKRIRKTQEKLFLEYNTNPNLIKTQFGILNKETTSYSMYVLDQGDFNSDAPDFATAIQGRIPIRRHVGSISSSASLVYELDGVIMSGVPPISPAAIKRIAFIPGLTGTVLYGTIAKDGIFIINTHAGNFSSQKTAKKTRKNSYDYDIPEYNDLAKDIPQYIRSLKNCKNKEEAKKVYSEYGKKYNTSVNFALDIYQYFFELGDSKLADEIIKQRFELFENNPIALKALGYIYDVQRRQKEAHEVYKKLFILRSNYGQSYLDLANSYREIGEIEKAAGIFARYQYGLEKGLLKTNEVFEPIIDREYSSFLHLHKQKLFKGDVEVNLNKDIEIFNTRLVFEWNDSEAEFKLEFVNPNGDSYNVENSLLSDATLINGQKLVGFSMQEHLLDDSFLGKWQVNVEYFGNKSLTPIYLKITVYNNYNGTSQQKEIKVFKLRIKGVNHKLFDLDNSGIVSAN